MDLLSTYFFINRLILFFVLMLFFTGVWATRKEQLYFVVYIFLSLAIYICWPAWQGLRFIFPILPFIIYFIIKGFEQFVLALKITPRYPAALLICGLCYMSYQSLQRIIDFSKVDTNLAYNAETKLMYAYISNNIPEGEIIGFAKPRPLRLFTGRNSILSDLEHFDGSGLTYLLIRAEDVPSGAKIPYKKVYETKRLILVLR
jgi:hypothetical protein